MRDSVHVVAGVVQQGDRILLTRRPPGSHLENLWEFPGGKVEQGESRLDALRRELLEEIGITVVDAEPLIRVLHQYPDKLVDLDVWRILSFRGSADSHEGQQLDWVPMDGLGNYAMPEADRPVLKALRLPREYWITPEPEMDVRSFRTMIQSGIERGARLIQLRTKSITPDYLSELIADLMPLCRASGVQLLVNCPLDIYASLPESDGIHLTIRELYRATGRPIGSRKLLGASCHSLEDLCQAARINADFAVLSPVGKTASHPQAETIGWEGFQQLAAAAVVPVYALGGVRRADQRLALTMGAQGVSGISGFWSSQN